MTFPRVSPADWRAQVEQELAGAPFDKALVHETIEGIAIAPLYTEAPAVPRVLGDGAPFRVCMRHDENATRAAVLEDLEGGADALWLAGEARAALPEPLDPDVLLLVDGADACCSVGGESAALVSTVGFHAQGADACDEIAVALSTTVARLAAGARSLLVRVAAGRDVFVELSKIRALRLCLRKVLSAYGEDPRTLRGIHAVASSRTIAARDPWVNILRVTTQVFAAVLGGADFVTPLAFDEALSAASPLGRRIARNTGHVLREESALGRVLDPGAGAYYLDTLTDVLARDAWARFRMIERQGGIAGALANGTMETRIAATRRTRLDQIARCKLPIVGVSVFANLAERLPSRPRAGAAISAHDSAAFETLRARADALAPEATEVVIATLGPPLESRERVDFAAAFFASGGLRARELGQGEHPPTGAIACLCGSDERYAREAAARVRVLRSEGCRRVLVAGKPGSLEGDLRRAGVDAFLFVGCDAIAVLDPLLGEAP
jgi:methylmalonyl-CoA mutase